MTWITFAIECEQLRKCCVVFHSFANADQKWKEKNRQIVCFSGLAQVKTRIASFVLL